MKHDRFYGERDSPFFRLITRKKLAKLLFSSKSKLESLAREEFAYIEFSKRKKDGGLRQICAPRGDLKLVQKRIANLLHRITPPDYLFAPVSGRSYVDNAAAHLGAKSIRLLDIENFYQNCTANKVFWFFHKRMQCSRDVSAIMTGLVTHNESLPQGSPCSPILAYLCYVDMWEEIAQVIDDVGCTLSVYIDDLTISGDIVHGESIWKIKKILHNHGHNYSIHKERSKYLRPVEITGVILRPDGQISAPNRQHKKLHKLRHELSKTKSVETRIGMEAELAGRIAQFHQISVANSNN